MIVLLLYAHDSSAMGHQSEKRLIGTYIGSTEEECKKKVEQEHKTSFVNVIANWCSYEIVEAK